MNRRTQTTTTQHIAVSKPQNLWGARAVERFDEALNLPYEKAWSKWGHGSWGILDLGASGPGCISIIHAPAQNVPLIFSTLIVHISMDFSCADKQAMLVATFMTLKDTQQGSNSLLVTVFQHHQFSWPSSKMEFPHCKNRSHGPFPWKSLLHIPGYHRYRKYLIFKWSKFVRRLGSSCISRCSLFKSTSSSYE